MQFFAIFVLAFTVPLIVTLVRTASGKEPYRTVIVAVLITATCILGVLIGAEASGQSLGEQLSENSGYFADILLQDSEAVEALGFGDLTPEEQRNRITEAYEAVNATFPSMIFIFVTVLSYLYLIICTSFFRKRAQEMPKLRDFSWGGRGFVAALCVMYIGSYIGELAGAVPAGIALSANIGLIFEFVIMVQGLAVVFFFLYAKKLPKFLGILLVLFALGSVLFKFVLLAIGFIDYIVDIRKKIHVKE